MKKPFAVCPRCGQFHYQVARRCRACGQLLEQPTAYEAPETNEVRQDPDSQMGWKPNGKMH